MLARVNLGYYALGLKGATPRDLVGRGAQTGVLGKVGHAGGELVQVLNGQAMSTALLERLLVCKLPHVAEKGSFPLS